MRELTSGVSGEKEWWWR